jgi:hypothetical protein
MSREPEAATALKQISQMLFVAVCAGLVFHREGYSDTYCRDKQKSIVVAPENLLLCLLNSAMWVSRSPLAKPY